MLERLIASNPWWMNPTAIEQDPHIRAWTDGPIRWMPRIAIEIDLSLPGIYTIRGPRQVGKTTALKLMIRRSIEEAAGEGVMYYSCDLDSDPDAIREAVQTAKRLRPGVKRWRIFLDEVTSISGWEKGVKWLWDNTDARRDTFVLTGSSAVDLMRGTDRLPGRRGNVLRPDRILLPLSFPDFARLHGVPPPLMLRPDEFLNADVQDELVPLLAYLPELEVLFRRYLRVGGFPAAVLDEYASGHVSDSTLRTIWELVENELQRQRMDPVRAFRVIEHLVRALGHPSDWASLAEAIDADRRTAEDYARLLALTFVSVILYKADPRRPGPHLRAQRKLYFTDPLFAYLPMRVRQSAAAPEIPDLVENAVIMGLFRCEEQPRAESFLIPQALFYWRSKSGGEVDALTGITERVAVEVKYRRHVGAKDILALTRSFPRGIVVTQDLLDVQDRRYPKVPAAMFLWLLAGESVVPGR